MASNNSSSTVVDTTTFYISPLKITFKFKSLPNRKIVLDETGSVRSISKFYFKRTKAKHTLATQNTTISSQDSTASDSLPDTLSVSILPVRDSLHQDSNLLITKVPANINPNGEAGKPIVKSQSDWMIGVSLFILILMAIIRFSFSKYLSKLIDSIFNNQISNNLFSEKNMRNLRGSMFLNLLFYVNIAFFLTEYYQHMILLNDQAVSFFLFLYTLIGIFGLYMGKTIVIRSIAYIFNGSIEGKEYLHNVFLYNKNLGIFLLPITLSVPFINEFAVPTLLYIGLTVSLIFYLFRLGRGIKILFAKHVSIFYMILYLCALEILPLLVIYKLLNLLA